MKKIAISIIAGLSEPIGVETDNDHNTDEEDKIAEMLFHAIRTVADEVKKRKGSGSVIDVGDFSVKLRRTFP